MPGIIGLIVEIIAGVIGGNAAGAAAKKASLGTASNSIAGAIGGSVLGRILVPSASASPEWPRLKAPRPPAPVSTSALIAQLVGGGAGGAVLTLIVGLIRNMMRK